MLIQFVLVSILREIQEVLFFEACINGSNGADVVIHHKNAISASDNATLSNMIN